MRAARIATQARRPRRDDAGAYVLPMGVLPMACLTSPTLQTCDDNASAHANNPTPDTKCPAAPTGGTNDP